MNETERKRPRGHRVRTVQEFRHDTYKLRAKLPEPTICPTCGACYTKGRWVWQSRPDGAVHEHTCPACQRIADRYPAGVITLSGAFVDAHRDEIMNLVNNSAEAERAEHPLNRIMAVEEQEGAVVVSTTDIHLPRRIGKALHDAWHGDLDVHYDEEGYFVRVGWFRAD